MGVRSVAVLVLFALSSVTGLVVAEPQKKPSNDEVARLFSTQAGQNLHMVGTNFFATPPDGSYASKVLSGLGKKGFIQYQTQRLSPIQQAMMQTSATSGVQLQFTSTGIQNSIPVKGNEKSRCFEFGRRTLERIVDISPDGIVLVAAQYVPNELGLAIGDTAGKYRYRLRLTYDAFLDRFNLAEMRGSEWEVEEWGKPFVLTATEKGTTMCIRPEGD